MDLTWLWKSFEYGALATAIAFFIYTQVTRDRFTNRLLSTIVQGAVANTKMAEALATLTHAVNGLSDDIVEIRSAVPSSRRRLGTLPVDPQTDRTGG